MKFSLNLLCLLPLMGPLSAETPQPPPKIQVYFSPRDHLDQKLISFINQETISIKAAVYCLTHRDVIKALIEAEKRGVHVEIIIDKYTVKAKAPLRKMAQSGIALYVWDPPIQPISNNGKPRVPLMHNKFCLFASQELVWSGSFNFTSDGAISNQENVILIKQEESIKLFEEQFIHIRESGCKSWRDYLAMAPKKQTSKPPRKSL